MSLSYYLVRFKPVEARARLPLEVAILRQPVGVWLELQGPFQRRAGFRGPPHLEEGLGQEEQGGDAVRVVGQGAAQVGFRLLEAPTEQPRDLQVPSPERAVGRAVLVGRVDRQHPLERFPDRRPVPERLGEALGLGQSAHGGGQPKVSFGPVPPGRDRQPPGAYAELELASALIL